MNIYDMLKEENQKFWDLLEFDKEIISAEDLAYWDDEENNIQEVIETM